MHETKNILPVGGIWIVDEEPPLCSTSTCNPCQRYRSASIVPHEDYSSSVLGRPTLFRVSRHRGPTDVQVPRRSIPPDSSSSAVAEGSLFVLRAGVAVSRMTLCRSLAGGYGRRPRTVCRVLLLKGRLGQTRDIGGCCVCVCVCLCDVSRVAM